MTEDHDKEYNEKQIKTMSNSILRPVLMSSVLKRTLMNQLIKKKKKQKKETRMFS